MLDAPFYLPYSEGLVTPEQLGDKGMLTTFEEVVTYFNYTVSEDPDGGDLYYCHIEARTSLWDKWSSKGNSNLTAAVTTGQTKPIIARYDPHSENRMDRNVVPSAFLYARGTTLFN